MTSCCIAWRRWIYKRLQKQRHWICLRFPLLTSEQLFFWTLDRNIIHSISENFSFTFVSWIGMLENFGSKITNIIFLDLEGFKLKSLGFIIRELSLCSSYNDTIFLKPHLNSLIYPHTIDKLLFGWPVTCTVLIGTKVIYLIVNWKQSVRVSVSDSPGQFFLPKALKLASSSVSFYKKLTGISNLVFDVNNKERPPWCFCSNSTMPSSEVIIFVQVSIIVLMIILCFSMLFLLSESCEE